jgi:rubrerythrin
VCDKQFRSEDALEQHENATGHVVWSCDVCDKEFASEEALEQHETATGHQPADDEDEDDEDEEEEYACEECGKAFKSESALAQHASTTGHGEVVWQCPFCLAQFDSEMILDAHARVAHDGGGMMVTPDEAPSAVLVPMDVDELDFSWCT